MKVAPSRPPTDRPPIRERARAPESIAAALSVLVLGAVMVGGPLGRTSSAPASPAGSAATESTTPTVQPTPAVDATVIEVLTAINDRLAAIGGQLDTLSVAAKPSAAAIATAIRELNVTARNGLALIPQLTRQPGAGPVADRLAAFYGEITDAADAALRVTLSNAGAYQQAAAALVVIVDDLPALQADIQALLLVPGPIETSTPGPSTVASGPPATPTASGTASPEVTPGDSAAPSPAETLVPGGPELLVDGSFDTGVGAPWRLAVEAGAVATVKADGTMVVSPPSAARIEIVTDTASRSAIALQQPGMPVQAGGTYLLRAQLAASADREVVLRVASTAGVTYGARIVTVTTAWAIYELAFTAPIEDPNAVVTIELGRSTETTWVDDVSFREVTASILP